LQPLPASVKRPVQTFLLNLKRFLLAIIFESESFIASSIEFETIEVPTEK